LAFFLLSTVHPLFRSLRSALNNLLSLAHRPDGPTCSDSRRSPTRNGMARGSISECPGPPRAGLHSSLQLQLRELRSWSCTPWLHPLWTLPDISTSHIHITWHTQGHTRTHKPRHSTTRHSVCDASSRSPQAVGMGSSMHGLSHTTKAKASGRRPTPKCVLGQQRSAQDTRMRVQPYPCSSATQPTTQQ
jgi:hypothetical protein